MATSGDIIFDQLQISLFPKDFKIESPVSTAQQWLEEKLLKNDNSLIVSPTFEGIPGEFVVIEGNISGVKDVSLKVSPAKVSIYWYNTESVLDFSPNLSEIKSVLERVFDSVLKGATLWRVGYITTVYKILDNPSPHEVVKRSLSFKKNPDVPNQADLVLTYDLGFDKWPDIKFNKHIVINTGFVTNEPEKLVLAVQYDLNTHQDEKLDWGFEETSKFVNEAKKISAAPDKIYDEFFG